jgi:hypothetical protein
MNEQTTTGAGTSAAQEATTSTAQDEWQKLADSLPNRDGHIQTTDPLFHSGDSFWPVTILKPERTAARDDKGVAIRVNFRFDCETVDTQGTKRAPGHVFRPRPYVIDNPDDQAAAERGCRDLARDMERLGILPRLGSHSKGSLIAAVGKLADRKAKIKLVVKDGKERDEETGQVKKFQNFVVTSAESPESNGAGVASKGPSLANV